MHYFMYYIYVQIFYEKFKYIPKKCLTLGLC